VPTRPAPTTNTDGPPLSGIVREEVESTAAAAVLISAAGTEEARGLWGRVQLLPPPLVLVLVVRCAVIEARAPELGMWWEL